MTEQPHLGRLGGRVRLHRQGYGYQLGVKHHYPQGDMDQVDKILWDLKHDPASRRILAIMYNHHDLSEMALYPCAYSVTFNVSGRTLNAILNQRSQDMLTANNWNVAQYAVLVHMMAQASGLEAGELVHVIADATSMTGTSPWCGSCWSGRPPGPGLRHGPGGDGFLSLHQGQLPAGGVRPPAL